MHIENSVIQSKVFFILILLVSLLILTACPEIQGSKRLVKASKIIPQEQVTPEPENHIPSKGDVWISPKLTEVKLGHEFSTRLYLKTGNETLNAYGIILTYDNSLITVNTEKGEDSGVDKGADAEGFAQAVNAHKDSELIISGFDIHGIGPFIDANAHLLTVYWKAQKQGNCEIGINIKDAVTSDISDISLNGINAYVKVIP